MLPSEVIAHARYLAKVSASDGTGDWEPTLRIFNDYYLRQVTKFAEVNQNKFGRKARTTLNITADQEAYRLPFDCLRVKRVEITYDGTNWRKLTIEDSSKVQNMALDSTTIQQQYEKDAPRADIYGDSIFLRPIPTTGVSLALRLWYLQMPTLLTTGQLSNASFLITPIEYHGYLSDGIAVEFAKRQGKDNFIAAQMKIWNDSLLKIENDYAPQVLDQPIDIQGSSENYG